ncbi:pro-opiomelanocortin, partial [Seriola lalandi dorsalis]
SSSSSSSSSSPQAKRSYSMEHFRWGKPVGRKRRPVKVYTSNGVEEESAEVFPGEMRRRELASELLAAAEEEDKVQEVMEEAEEEEQQQLSDGEKKDGSYKMKHFRWSGPPANKRYGGFMKSWDERSQRPLLTLFKNVINKDGQQQK